jgi:hypothetical protein
MQTLTLEEIGRTSTQLDCKNEKSSPAASVGNVETLWVINVQYISDLKGKYGTYAWASKFLNQAQRAETGSERHLE